MRELSVVRWTKYGHDRLYVRTLSGDQVGWGDLRTGAVTVIDDSMSDQLRMALAEHPLWTWPPPPDVAPELPTPANCEAAPGVVVDHLNLVETHVELPSTEIADVNDPSAVAWDDLALSRAGSAARAQAIAAREAAPVRTLAARLLGVHTDERAWRIGADGEEKVAARLAKLVKKDPRWRVLHAVPVGTKGSDIDHVVIGPGGIYTLNAKHHPDAKLYVRGDRFMVNGRFQPYVRNSRFEAQRASKLLTEAIGRPVPVTGVVVPLGAESLTVKEQPADVWVVARMQIHTWLRARPQVLTDTAVEEIYEVARRSSTWHG